MEEIWKNVIGFENLYEVSNLGNVKRCGGYETGHKRHGLTDTKYYRKEHILKQQSKRGYMVVSLYNNGSVKQLLVHRLVWEAFNGPIPKDMEINHLSEDKTDNRLENLSLVTHAQNNRWGTRTARAAQALSKKVLQYDTTGDLIYEWSSLNEASRKTDVPLSNLWSCCIGKRKTAGGFIWKYA